MPLLEWFVVPHEVRINAYVRVPEDQNMITLLSAAIWS